MTKYSSFSRAFRVGPRLRGACTCHFVWADFSMSVRPKVRSLLPYSMLQVLTPTTSITLGCNGAIVHSLCVSRAHQNRTNEAWKRPSNSITKRPIGRLKNPVLWCTRCRRPQLVGRGAIHDRESVVVVVPAYYYLAVGQAVEGISQLRQSPYTRNQVESAYSNVHPKRVRKHGKSLTLRSYGSSHSYRGSDCYLSCF